MKLEIDFDQKIITIDGTLNLGELVDKLKELKLDWRDFKVQSNNGWTIYPTWPTWPTYPTIEPCRITYEGGTLVSQK